MTLNEARDRALEYRRLAQRISAVLDVAKSKGYRDGQNPVTTIRDARFLLQIKKKVQQITPQNGLTIIGWSGSKREVANTCKRESASGPLR